MTLGQAFSIRLSEILEERKLSVHRFVKETCIPRSTIVNLLKGNTKSPTLALIYQVADGLNMTYLEFLDHPVFRNKDIDFLSWLCILMRIYIISTGLELQNCGVCGILYVESESSWII